MHRVDAGNYIGEPGEQATLATELDGGGQVRVTLDNQDTGATRQFTLGANPGDRRTLRIALAGPLGATCVVTIAAVDGTTDGDFLICQPHDPAPVHTYTFDAAAKVAIAKFAIAVGAATPPAPKTPVVRKSTTGAKDQKVKPAGKRSGA
jgi:hypothetical protein